MGTIMSLNSVFPQIQMSFIINGHNKRLSFLVISIFLHMDELLLFLAS